MTSKDTSHRDRVNQAIAFEPPDRTPRDFAAVPEIWEQFVDHFGTSDRHELLKNLDVDCRIVSYDSFCQPPEVEEEAVDMDASQERSSVGGMWRKVEPDGSNRDIWGGHRKAVPHQYGAFDQFVSFPLESAETLDDLQAYNWPEPDWWDFSPLSTYIDSFNDDAIYNIRYRIGSVFETSWSLYNFEKFLHDLALNPSMPSYVMERIAEVHLKNLRTVLDMAADKIDVVYFYDDIASQEGLLISPQMYEKYIQPYHQQIIDLAGQYNKPVMMHCCGSVYRMIDHFIDMGLSILNPIQPAAYEMEPERLAEEFGGRITFHGGVGIQEFLPNASPYEVKEKVQYLSELLGTDGGYIMASAHHIQSDTPLDNVLAMYGILE